MKNEQSASWTLDTRALFELGRSLQNSINGFPTAIVTTEDTFADLKKTMESAYGGDTARMSELTVYGIRVETHPTVRECLDRMHALKPYDRLQLFLKEGIPVDCFDHPWIRDFITSIVSKEEWMTNE